MRSGRIIFGGGWYKLSQEEKARIVSLFNSLEKTIKADWTVMHALHRDNVTFVILLADE
jgi:hypothetical protein